MPASGAAACAPDESIRRTPYPRGRSPASDREIGHRHVGVNPVLVVVTAAAIALPLSVFPFRIGPRRVQQLFFRENGSWRPYARGARVAALAALLLMALRVTPRGGA